MVDCNERLNYDFQEGLLPNDVLRVLRVVRKVRAKYQPYRVMYLPSSLRVRGARVEIVDLDSIFLTNGDLVRSRYRVQLSQARPSLACDRVTRLFLLLTDLGNRHVINTR